MLFFKNELRIKKLQKIQVDYMIDIYSHFFYLSSKQLIIFGDKCFK